MAEEEVVTPIESEEPDETPGYKAPEKKSINELQQLDAHDESLVKYKETLLGSLAPGAAPADDPRRVVVQKMVFITEGRPDVEFDLSSPDHIEQVKSQILTIKEGVSYRIKIVFKVQHEIVSGLRFHMVISRKGLNVDKNSYMVGSYGPRVESHEFTCKEEDAPKGMVARGSYKAKCQFLDDDKNVHLAWEWKFEIKKDWD